ncbi:MAG: hypothetical protein NT129_02555 [Candidatus Aenigmarchaeota archaeon]|nr:hypothetical protein [Candidatus Aenigmarchaeota archaeon]
MDKIFYAMIFGVFILVFIFGCAVQTDEECQELTQIAFSNITTDKPVYHSSEVMNLSMIIYSESEIENVSVKANGINGRFSEEKLLDLNKGMNEIIFTYQLPRCNVCGGISAGDYNLSFTISYKNISIEDSKIINIQQ